MNKQELLAQLEKGLIGLPQEDIKERLAFYGEMIDDRIEEGYSEEQAVSDIGSPETVIGQIIADTPLTKIVKERIKPKRALRVWEIVLLILGFPLWFPLLIAAAAVALSVYVSLWAAIVSLWAVELAFVICAVSLIIAAVFLVCCGETGPGVLSLGTGLLLAGLSIFMFYGCLAAAKGIILLSKKAINAIKKTFVGKENEA